MSLTLSDAVSEVRSNVNETTAAYWSDAEIETWVKQGCRIFSSESLMVEGTEDLDPLIANQLSYDSSDESWIGTAAYLHTAIYYDGGTKYKGLIKVQPHQIGNVATFTSGAPKYVCFFDHKIYVWPLTTAAIVSANGIITFLIAKETNDITEIQDQYQYIPILYATAKAKQKDRKFTEAGTLMKEFEQKTVFERKDKLHQKVTGVGDFAIPGKGNDNG